MKFKNSNPLGAAIFMSFAGFGLFSIWTEWSQSPHQAYQRVTGSVLSHSIAVDKVLWIGREAAPLRLTSTVLLDGREIRVTDTFESSEKAWAAALARPPESDTEFAIFAAPDGQQHVWRRLPEFQIGIFLFTAAFFVIGLSLLFHSHSKFSAEYVLPVVVSAVFTIGGSAFVIRAMSKTAESFRASRWPSVEYEEIGSQRLKSGKRGVNATAFRYSYMGQTYETVVREKPAPDGMCRVDPERPWIAALSTNYWVSAAGILLGLPFLAGGIGVGVILYRRRKTEVAD